MIKKCKKCGNEFPENTEYFHRSSSWISGFSSSCKACVKEKKKKWESENKNKLKIYYQRYYHKNKEKENERSRKYHRLNAGKIIAHKKEYFEKNIDAKRAYGKKYYEKNKKEINRKSMEIHKRNYKKDAFRYLNLRMGSAIRQSIGMLKNGHHWETLVGYTLIELKQHLENKFESGMSWENYGRFGWHIDHIRPISSFKFNSADDEEFKECWALENLQPLWAKENLKKGSKI